MSCTQHPIALITAECSLVPSFRCPLVHAVEARYRVWRPGYPVRHELHSAPHSVDNSNTAECCPVPSLRCPLVLAMEARAWQPRCSSRSGHWHAPSTSCVRYMLDSSLLHPPKCQWVAILQSLHRLTSRGTWQKPSLALLPWMFVASFPKECACTVITDVIMMRISAHHLPPFGTQHHFHTPPLLHHRSAIRCAWASAWPPRCSSACTQCTCLLSSTQCQTSDSPLVCSDPGLGAHVFHWSSSWLAGAQVAAGEPEHAVHAAAAAARRFAVHAAAAAAAARHLA